MNIKLTSSLFTENIMKHGIRLAEIVFSKSENLNEKVEMENKRRFAQRAGIY